ncbi:pyocin S6 family toxin immunity protein [Pseudomonas sp. 14P_8.1_Bac3]|uniref:pyocin S6 family toxin immunity protein n=1 Tax=Pseudomonas sp. 14P_8.1_Bac3 TaxID=2971621 RepID=UPI0021C748A4|nr:pyocin S6 family toxin immunity protein [Pseudomonas sp. 14P_8.1_Bac3]MCU1760275.1 pyocin S6 family toxin immunity protein [Pseudomonas sp. 14P_8.1_Bac3]
MYLCISGFLSDSSDDTSLKYELDVAPEFEQRIVSLLGHESMSAMASGEWLLTAEQVRQIAALTHESIPLDLDVFIGVET